MPPKNERRRRALTDAAIALLASDGGHGLTHRAVEKAANVPAGTASNYFPTRESLLVAAAERVVELHLAEMESASRDTGAACNARGGEASPTEEGPGDPLARLVDLLTDSLLRAATGLRSRYLAIYELRLEAGRRPALASALSALGDSMQRQTQVLHAEPGTPVPDFAIRTLPILYTGTLFTLVTTPPEGIDAATVRVLAEAIVEGAFAGHGREGLDPGVPAVGPGRGGRVDLLGADLLRADSVVAAMRGGAGWRHER